MFIYFIRAGNSVKVGITDNIKERLGAISVHNPHKCEVLCSLELLADEAKKVEKEIHDLFTRTHSQGEWFQATEFMVEFIGKIKSSSFAEAKLWIDIEFNKKYKKHLNRFKLDFEDDIIKGNFIFAEKLQYELGEIGKLMLVAPLLPKNIAQGVRKWIEKRTESFSVQDIYNHFGITDKKAKNRVRVALTRIKKDSLVNIKEIAYGKHIYYPTIGKKEK